jgi:MFS transporter, ENTS family, enterobactin (siderophore) exporter
VCLIVLSAGPTLWRPLASSYSPWDGDVTAPGRLAAWLLGATTEPNFYTAGLSGIGLLAGGAFAHWRYRTHRRARGFVLACGSGFWPAVVASALLGLLISNLVWGWSLAASSTWQPTFVPFVSVSPTVVLLFGPSLRNVITGGVLGGLVTTPFSLVATNFVCHPLDLPPVIGVTGGMAVGAMVAFALCRVLPFIDRYAPVSEAPQVAAVARSRGSCARRVLADFSEAQFFGNEWASAGMLAGALAAYLVNSRQPVYGTGLLPDVLLGQAVAAITGVALWRNRWGATSFYPTFVPIVSVAPAAALTYDGSLTALLVGSTLGAVIAPPLAAAIARRLPADFHPFIGNVASMAISTAAIVPALGLSPA